MNPSCSTSSDTYEFPWKLVIVKIPEASVEVLEADLNWETGLLDDLKLFSFLSTVLRKRTSQEKLSAYTELYVRLNTIEMFGYEFELLVNYLTTCALICMDKLEASGHYLNYKLQLTLIGISNGCLVFKRND
jgi:hypothetical protein